MLNYTSFVTYVTPTKYVQGSLQKEKNNTMSKLIYDLKKIKRNDNNV